MLGCDTLVGEWGGVGVGYRGRKKTTEGVFV